MYREVIGYVTTVNYMYCKRLLDYYREKYRDDVDVLTRFVNGNHDAWETESLRFMTRKKGP